jgi:hypothetical protein
LFFVDKISPGFVTRFLGRSISLAMDVAWLLFASGVAVGVSTLWREELLEDSYVGRLGWGLWPHAVR